MEMEIPQTTWDAIVALLGQAYPGLTCRDVRRGIEIAMREKTEHVTMREAQSMLRCSRTTLWRLASDGRVGVCHPVGGRTLYSLGDIRRLLEA